MSNIEKTPETADIVVYPMQFKTQVYTSLPNPFSESTAIRFECETQTNVKISIYNLLGEHVETILDRQHETGYYEIRWYPDGIASGVYFYRIQIGDYDFISKGLYLH